MALVIQRLRQRLGPGAAGTIDDARLSAPCGNEGQQLLARAVLGLKGQPDIGAVEAAQEGDGFGAVEQAGHDLGPRLGIGGRREGRQRHAQHALQFADAQVIGPEVVTPLADAMRLVHGDGGDARPAQQIDRPARGQPFRRHVEQFQFAPFQRRQDRIGFVLRIAAGQRAGRHARRGQRANLIAHQGDQRRDDDRCAVAHQRGQLIAQRLAAAGRHDRQNLAALGHGLDDLALAGSKAVKAPDLPQKIVGGHVPGHHMP